MPNSELVHGLRVESYRLRGFGDRDYRITDSPYVCLNELSLNDLSLNSSIRFGSNLNSSLNELSLINEL